MNLDLSYESLLRASTRAAELFTEIYSALEQRRVAPAVSRDELSAIFARSIGEEGIGLDAVLEEFATSILPNSMGTPHPLYFGLVNSSPLPAGPIADLLISSLNNNGGSFHQSPAISTLEREVVAEFAALCGYARDAAGMIVPGGTFANTQGLLLARHASFPEWDREGPGCLTGQPLLYQSDQTHFCNARAAQVIGIGQHGIVTVPSVGRGVMDLKRLESQIITDRQAGQLPFAVVASAGTTATGAIDDLDGIADICQRHALWLHVDACYGGGGLLLTPKPENFHGLHRADSIAIDPHKWFFVPMTAGLFLTKRAELLLDTFDVAAPYIPADQTVDAFRVGLPTSRRSTGLAVWMILRAHGWRTIRQAVTRNVQLIRQLEELLRSNGLRVLEGGQLSVACVRFEPAGFTAPELDDLQKRIVSAVVDSGQAWFSTTEHRNQIWIRLNLVNIHTREHHVRTLAELISESARQCLAPM